MTAALIFLCAGLVLQCLGLFANVLLGTMHSRLVVASYWFSFVLHMGAAAFYLPFYEAFVDAQMNAAYACQALGLFFVGIAHRNNYPNYPLVMLKLAHSPDAALFPFLFDA